MLKHALLKQTLLKIQGVFSYSLYLPFLPLLPVIFRQGKTVKTNTIRLPEADGPRHYKAAEHAAITPKNTLLHLGESTVAGVGVVEFQHGLTANITRILNQGAENPWSWQAMGYNGAPISELNKQLAAGELHGEPNLVLLTMGVNDTTAFTRRKIWRTELKRCINELEQRRFEQRPLNKPTPLKVCFTQVPPMHLFPALPFPLNLFLGLRAWQLDNSLQQLCLQQGWSHLKIEMPLQPEWMAVDGYHPNAEGYQRWAEKVTDLL